MVDLTEGAAELIAFGAADAHIRTIRNQDAELTAIASASARTAGVGLALTTLLAGLACWGCLIVGIPAVLSGRLGGTELAVITLVPLAAFELVVGLPVATQALHRVRQAAARVFEVLDAPAPVTDPEVAVALPGPPYDLEVRSAWASYPGAVSPALRGVDLSLPPGRRVAVVGPSGAGKSTLGAVLVGFLRSRAGSITLSGVPTEQLSGDDLRSVVGLVGQDAYLFDTTIADNLRVGRRDADGRRSCTTCSTGSGWRPGSVIYLEGWRQRWGRTGPACRGVSANVWPWPEPCWPTSRCSYSTKRPNISKPRPPTRSRPISWT